MTIPETIRADYEKWSAFLEQEVKFLHKESTIHTKDHCRRVLLFALLIADRKKMTAEQKSTLAAAAVFHDSRRLEDWLDTGHGRRAAEYYEGWCRAHGLNPDPLCSAVMAWHDRHDAEGTAAISSAFPDREDCLLLYQVFKDADALDRFRLGPDGLDVRYLRTAEARDLYGFAEKLSKTEKGSDPSIE